MPPIVQHSFRVGDGLHILRREGRGHRAKAGRHVDVKVDVQSQAMTVLLDPAVASPDAVARAIESIGYAVEQG